MIVLAFFRSFGNDSDRISCRQNKIAPAMAVATYTQKDRWHTRVAIPKTNDNNNNNSSSQSGQR